VRALTIGGATVALASVRGRRAWAVDRLHRAFLGNGGSPRVTLRVEPLGATPPDAGVLAFDSGIGWQIGRTRTGWACLFRHTDGGRQRLTQALVADRRWRRVTMYVERARAPFFMAYPVEQLLILGALAGRAALVVHAAGIVRGGRAWLFAGPHGAGKSTIAGLLAAERGTALLSDDRVVVRRLRGRWRAFGTPWSGTVRRATTPAGAPLAGVFFIRHGEATRPQPLAPAAAAARLVPRCLHPYWDRPALEALLAGCGGLATDVPCFDLPFVPEAAALSRVLATGPARPRASR
jgi:hypothetical protein